MFRIKPLTAKLGFSICSRGLSKNKSSLFALMAKESISKKPLLSFAKMSLKGRRLAINPMNSLSGRLFGNSSLIASSL